MSFAFFTFLIEKNKSAQNICIQFDNYTAGTSVTTTLINRTVPLPQASISIPLLDHSLFPFHCLHCCVIFLFFYLCYFLFCCHSEQQKYFSDLQKQTYISCIHEGSGLVWDLFHMFLHSRIQVEKFFWDPEEKQNRHNKLLMPLGASD